MPHASFITKASQDIENYYDFAMPAGLQCCFTSTAFLAMLFFWRYRCRMHNLRYATMFCHRIAAQFNITYYLPVYVSRDIYSSPIRIFRHFTFLWYRRLPILFRLLSIGDIGNIITFQNSCLFSVIIHHCTSLLSLWYIDIISCTLLLCRDTCI